MTPLMTPPAAPERAAGIAVWLDQMFVPVTLNGLLNAAVSPAAAAASLYWLATPLITIELKVAMPLTPPTLVLPPRVAPPGLAPKPIETVLVALVLVLPYWSWIDTATAGVMACPAWADAGWVVNPTLAGACGSPVAVKVVVAMPAVAIT